MPTIATRCKECNKLFTVPFRDNQPAICPHCATEWGEGETKKVFEGCVVCGSRHFWRQKDFNQTLGCVVMLIAILLVPATYGISLPVLALFDWFLYKKTDDMAICYRCNTEYRGFQIPTHINPFEHHLGEKFQEKEKNDS